MNVTIKIILRTPEQKKKKKKTKQNKTKKKNIRRPTRGDDAQRIILHVKRKGHNCCIPSQFNYLEFIKE